MESDNKLALVKPEGRDTNGNLLPATKEAALEQIDEHISSSKRVNIAEIARGLGVTWQASAKLVNELMERWKAQDTYKIQRYRKQLVEMASSLLNTIQDGAITIDQVRDVISLYQEMIAVMRLEDGEEVSREDESRIITVHFNDMRMTPAMIEDIQNTKRPPKIIEQIPKEQPVVEEQPPTTVDAISASTTEAFKDNPFLKPDGTDNTTGHTGDSEAVI